MEVHQLAYFETVSRHLHFTRAAEELNVAQPSVSQQIRKLEAELGTPLFHRMKRRVALTEAGQTFLPHARAVLQRLDELPDEPFVRLREGAYDVREQALAACRRAGFEPRVALDGSEMDSLLRFVAAGLGVAILPEMVLNDADPLTGPAAVRLEPPALT